MMLMGYWSCAVQPGTAMTAHGDDEVRRHKGCRTFLLRPRARRPSDPELPPRRSKSTYTLSHPPETARRQFTSICAAPRLTRYSLTSAGANSPPIVLEPARRSSTFRSARGGNGGAGGGFGGTGELDC